MNNKQLEALDPVRIKAKQKSLVTITARLKQEIYKELVKHCQEHKISINSMVAHSIIEVIKRGI